MTGADPGLVPIAEAARILGYRSTSTLRKLVAAGRLEAAGRRGGRGCFVFQRAELERFMRGEPVDAPPAASSTPRRPASDATSSIARIRAAAGPGPARGGAR